MWIVGAANWWKTWRIDWLYRQKKWWTNGELTIFSKGGIHQEIELAVPVVVVWVQTSRTHLDRSSLFPSLVTPLRKLSSLLKYVPPKKNDQCIVGDLDPSETTAQPLLLSLSCHGLCVSWAGDSDPRKTQAPSHHFTNHQPRSITWGTLFFRPHQGSHQEKRDSKRRAHERCDCHLVKLAHESSHQKIAWLIPACPKLRVSDLSFTNTQSCSERISIDIHGMWRRHKKTTTLQYCNKYWAGMVSQFM